MNDSLNCTYIKVKWKEKAITINILNKNINKSEACHKSQINVQEPDGAFFNYFSSLDCLSDMLWLSFWAESVLVFKIGSCIELEASILYIKSIISWVGIEFGWFIKLNVYPEKSEEKSQSFEKFSTHVRFFIKKIPEKNVFVITLAYTKKYLCFIYLQKWLTIIITLGQNYCDLVTIILLPC